MPTIKRFEEIISWHKARELNKIIGKYIDENRFKRNFRLTDQIERSAGSIMDNIAEGFERSGNKEFLNFLYVSKGFCGEFRSQLYRAFDRNYLNQAEFDDLYNREEKLLFYYKNSLIIWKPPS